MAKIPEQIALDAEDIKYQLAGSLLDFTQTFYRLRCHRLFMLSDPIGRESHYITISKALTKVLDGEISRLIINVPPRFGKAVAIDTPILTVDGWTVAGDIKVGDRVVGSKGWTTITGVFPQGVLPAREVIFNDGESVICNDEHLWQVTDRDSPHLDKIKTTKEIEDDLFEADGRKKWRIPLVNGDYGYVSPEIDPYLFGCWLGDGHSHYAAITTMDIEIVRAFVDAGHTLKPHTHQNGGKAITYGIIGNGFHTKLRFIGQLKNKHFPEDAYLWSAADRLALLQGLMDTDGTCHGTSRQPSFSNKNQSLIDGVKYLITSLGGTFKEYRRINQNVTISMRLPQHINPFRLKRKADLIRPSNRNYPTRFIAEILPANPTEMVCFTVDAEDHLYAVGRNLILTHNTEMLIHFVAWAMAIHPDSNFLYVSYNLDLAMKQTATIKNIIEMRQYRDIFGVRLSQDTRSKANFETTQGGSVYAAGAGGTITGRGAGVRGVLNRFTGAIIIDDIHKPDEATSDTIRESVMEWYYNTMISRCNNAQTPIIFIGQRVHEYDLAGHFIEQGGWHVVSLPAIDAAGNVLHPELKSKEDLLELEKKSPYVFAAQYQQNPQPAGGGIFKPEWFYICDEEPEILATFITADTAETSKTYNDPSVFSFWGIYKVENTDEYALHWLDCKEIRVEPKDLEEEFMIFYHDCCQHKVKPRLAVIEKKSTGVTLASSLEKVRGLNVKALDRSATSGSKTERFLAMQPYVAANLISFSKYAKHKDMCIEHMRKITANESHRFDDIADTCQMAVEVGLIEKSVRNYIFRQNDGKNTQTAANIMSTFKKIVDLRMKRDG